MAQHGNPLRKVLLLILAIIIVGGCFLWLRGGVSDWTAALAGDMEEGFRRGHPGLLSNLVDPEYDAFSKWPELRDFQQTGDQDSGQQAIKRALAAYFFQQRQAQRSLSVAFESPTLLNAAASDHSFNEYEVFFTLDIAVDGGPTPKPSQLAKHRFILRQHGWLFPSLTIIDHDSIPWP